MQFEKVKVKMAHTSTKRKKLITASVIVAIIIVSSIGAVVLINWIIQRDNVTVSGRAGVSGSITPVASIQTIEFTDIQTGIVTTFRFPFSLQSYNQGGNYSVTLKNGHTYNVYISFSRFNPENPETHYITTFTINASAGQTAITKNFGYPNQP